jgi:hypothetical protein
MQCAVRVDGVQVTDIILRRLPEHRQHLHKLVHYLLVTLCTVRYTKDTFVLT